MPGRQPARAADATSGSAVLSVAERVDAHLLSRGLVVLEAPGSRPSGPPPAGSAAGVVALEADVLERGHLLHADLRAALAHLSPDELAHAGHGLLAGLDARLGADKPHVPLFRRFPASTPRDTERLWVDRVLTVMLQEPDQPCVLCGTVGSVHAVAPCAHLVCDVCFDGSDYSACPVCRRRLDPADPFLAPTAGRRKVRETRRGPLRLLRLAAGRDAAVLAELERLLPRSAAPSAADLEALTVLVDHQAVQQPGDLRWLPGSVPARTAKATVLARLLSRPETRDAAIAVLAAHCDTATDVLRVAVVLTGGHADLSPTLDRVAKLPRPLRRALLATLDDLPVDTAAEDVLRHVPAWKKIAEKLHPFEHARQHPGAALLVAIARQTSLAAVEPGLRGLLEAMAGEHPGTVTVDGDRLRVATFAGAVESTLAGGALDAALGLLAHRPGELFRRLDHLLRLAAPCGDREVGLVLDAAAAAAPRVAPAVLVSALGELSRRDEAGSRRVFFPSGRIASLHAEADTRLPLPVEVVATVRRLVEDEMLRRAARLGSYELALLDASLAAVPVPFTARTTAKALVDVPRGSVLPLPAGDVLRLFLHWTEPATTRVDLDLSVAFYDADWSFVGLCDYTAMRFHGSAAVHSGDLTSAPAPLGATEFVDLDLLELSQTGAAYAVPVVFSYNDVPFDQMTDAFAGVMVRSAEAAKEGAHFDVRTVEQRFDLAGEARISVPMLLDLTTGRLCWVDMNLGSSGYGHDVRGYSAKLAELGRSLLGYHLSGRRTTMWQLAVWHAAARSASVAVRRGSGVDVYRRADQEAVSDFAARLDHAAAADASSATVPVAGLDHRGGPVLAVLDVGDVDLPAGSAAYALFPDVVGVSEVQLLSGLDLLSQLSPSGPAGAEGSP